MTGWRRFLVVALALTATLATASSSAGSPAAPRLTLTTANSYAYDPLDHVAPAHRVSPNLMERPVGRNAARNGQAGLVARTGVAAEDVGLSTRGLRPLPGTRVRPDGIPDNWRITGTDSAGGTRYYDPSNPGNSVRVMQGNPNSPYPNSQAPYIRWQQNGQPLDMYGNKLPSAKDPAAHIPLNDFTFLPWIFQ